MLKTLRDRGYKVVVFEAGNDLGGTWRWNCYPGAGVDSEVPEYEFSWPEVWKTWNWRSNYPTYKDLRAYFDHVDKVLSIKKDCAFNTVVVGGKFDTQQGKWTIQTEDGRISKAKTLVLGTGFVSSTPFFSSLCSLHLNHSPTPNPYKRLPAATFPTGQGWTSSKANCTIRPSGPTTTTPSPSRTSGAP